MDFRALLRSLLSKKLLTICVVAILIPQAVNLLLRLTWAILIILVLFLLFELCVVFVIKTWFPDKVNVSHVLEWTITTVLRIGHSLFNVLCHVVYSSFDLMFGTVFAQNGQVTRTNRQQRRQLEQRRDSTGDSVADPVRTFNRDGYTPMARKAMTNSSNRPNNRSARFSL